MREGAAQQAPEVLFDHEFITVYRALEPQLCEAVIDGFERDQNKWQGRVGTPAGVTQDEQVKQSWDLEIVNEGVWRALFQAIHAPIGACIAHYLSRSPVLQSLALQATGYRVQMYPRQQGWFRWHADAVGGASSQRLVAMVLYLNDVQRGGETEFFHQGVKIAPRAGQLVLFPATWNYMHCGHVPESGDKFVISTFVKAKA